VTPAPRVGDEVSPNPAAPSGQQRVGERRPFPQVFQQQDAGIGVRAEQARGNRHRHGVEVFQGGQLHAEAGPAAPVRPIPAFQHHGAARLEAQPDDVAPAPDPFRGLHDGWLAPRPGQQCLSRPGLACR